jgi:hypothetical protein
MRFQTIADEAVQVRAKEPLASFYQLSPFVWRESAEVQVMLRAVPRCEDPAKKIARIYHGVSDDGLTFDMDESPAIAPGPACPPGWHSLRLLHRLEPNAATRVPLVSLGTECLESP